MASEYVTVSKIVDSDFIEHDDSFAVYFLDDKGLVFMFAWNDKSRNGLVRVIDDDTREEIYMVSMTDFKVIDLDDGMLLYCNVEHCFKIWVTYFDNCSGVIEFRLEV